MATPPARLPDRPGRCPDRPGQLAHGPGRRRSTSARQVQPGQPQPEVPGSSGYPGGSAAGAPGWGSDRGGAAEAPSTQAGVGNPYGSYVDTAPPVPHPRPRGRLRRQPGPPAPAPAPGNSYPGYTTGPTTAYSDPYRPGSAGYPAGSPQPATGGRADQGTTWYPAPPPAAATPQPPASAYPYQPGPAYPATAGYGTQPGQAGYPGSPQPGARGDTRYRNGQTEDPYGPDGYSGYHSRQG